IIPGIGFIGAGSILHARGGVTGLTTAATLFVVASVGMACGGGYYVSAVFATALILLCLLVLGWMERRLNLKPILVNYTLSTERSMDEIMEELGAAMEEQDKEMRRTHINKTNGKKRVSFSVDATRQEHKQLLSRFRRSEPLRTIEASAEGDLD
ncbi:MAG: MgtC/SapB family protein, partial [Candidatus Angelobacter sp.]